MIRFTRYVEDEAEAEFCFKRKKSWSLERGNFTAQVGRQVTRVQNYVCEEKVSGLTWCGFYRPSVDG